MNTAILLRSSATALQASAELIDAHSEQLGYHVDMLRLTGLSGAGPESGMEQVRLRAERLAPPARRMMSAARVLNAFSEIFHRLEDDVARASSTYGSEAVERILMPGVRVLGDALDWACARSIDALCTPEMEEPARRLEDFEGLSIEAIHELHLLTAPPHVRQLAAENPDMRILEADDGRLVAVVGAEDLATSPATVTTFVPGVGSSDPGRWSSSIGHARAISAATGGPVVAWIGYSAPKEVPHAALAEPARRGGSELRRFQSELRRRFPESRLTVAGYSYGSVVAGQAAQQGEGLAADNLVLVGSPGTGAEHVSELHFDVPDVDVFAVTNYGDPIAYGVAHGEDPADPEFGAQPLPGLSPRRGNHSSYFSDPEFLAALGRAARDEPG